MKISTSGYVYINNWQFYKLKAVPTGKRNTETNQAEFIIIDRNPYKLGKVWLNRNEIC